MIILRTSHDDDVRGIAIHILEVGITLHLLRIFLLEYLRGTLDKVGILHHSHSPCLLVHRTRRMDATLGYQRQFLVLHRLVEILANGTASHDRLDYLIGQLPFR